MQVTNHLSHLLIIICLLKLFIRLLHPLPLVLVLGTIALCALNLMFSLVIFVYLVNLFLTSEDAFLICLLVDGIVSPNGKMILRASLEVCRDFAFIVLPAARPCEQR